jgi:hypothetical protein
MKSIKLYLNILEFCLHKRKFTYFHTQSNKKYFFQLATQYSEIMINMRELIEIQKFNLVYFSSMSM